MQTSSAPRPLSPAVATVLLAAATGARTFFGVAATAQRIAATSEGELREPARSLARPQVVAGISALRAFELVVDKLPFIGNRTDAGQLAGRLAIGAVIGASIAAAAGKDRAVYALLGAAAAFVGAHVGFRVRHELSALVPPTIAAVVEDAAVAALARAGARSIG
jgi:uncharacterized membrane protein